MMRRRRKIMVIKCSGGRVDINQPEDNRACFDHLLRTIYRTGCTWYKSCRKWKWRKRDYDRDNATMLTCRLHTWSKQRGKHCRWFEPLRFQCPFHICHTYPCASERISWRWVRYIIRLSEWVMEMILMMVMLLSPCNPFRRRSCPPRSSKCQLSLPRTQSSAAGSPSLTSSRNQQSSLSSSYISLHKSQYCSATQEGQLACKIWRRAHKEIYIIDMFYGEGLIQLLVETALAPKGQKSHFGF